MNKFDNCVAVITGAGSGIGRALAYNLADQGAQLAIADISADNLAMTKAELDRRGCNSSSRTLDVADQAAVFSWAEDIERDFGQVNLVINNAGVGLASGNLWETPLDDFKWLMDINFYGVLYGTKAFLPILQRAEWGHIVNISSLFGLVGVPTQTAYNASKFAVRGMTEALRIELEMTDSSVSCTSVHPGGIKTNIARAARVSDNGVSSKEEHDKAADDFENLARTTPESAAEQIVRAVRKNKRRLLIGMDARIIDKLQRLVPTGYGKILTKLIYGNRD